MFARIWCFFNIHEHRRSKVRSDGRKLVSVCRVCGAPLVRLKNGDWVDSRHEY